MNLNYNFRISELSLKDISAIQVANKILECYMAKNDELPYYSAGSVVEYAKNELAKLCLPREVMDYIYSFILMTNKAINCWYVKYPMGTRPVLTPLGTIDMQKSTELLANSSKLSIRQRFILACNCCNVKLIPKIGSQLDDIDVDAILHGRTDLLAKFWLMVYRIWGDVEFEDDNVERVNYAKGFVLALCNEEEQAIKFFMEKATVDSLWSMGCFKIAPLYDCSPMIISSLFSKLGLEQQRQVMPYFAESLLSALLQWPYQSFFLKASHALLEHLSTFAYGSLAEKILKYLPSAKFYNFQEVFVEFWKLRRDTDVDVFVGNEVVYNAVRSADKLVIKLVFGDLEPEYRDKILVRSLHSAFSELQCNLDWKIFKNFVKLVVGIWGKDLLDKFKNTLVQSYYLRDDRSGFIYGRNYESALNWNMMLNRTIKILEKISAGSRETEPGLALKRKRE